MDLAARLKEKPPIKKTLTQGKKPLMRGKLNRRKYAQPGRYVRADRSVSFLLLGGKRLLDGRCQPGAANITALGKNDPRVAIHEDRPWD